MLAQLRLLSIESVLQVVGDGLVGKLLTREILLLDPQHPCWKARCNSLHLEPQPWDRWDGVRRDRQTQRTHWPASPAELIRSNAAREPVSQSKVKSDRDT